MHFTREPIIETIITPKEGYRLVVRSSRGGGSPEEFSVDAVEVVSFGHSFFFRSLEKPKSFIVPVSDYEVVEVKEARVILKNVSVDKAIKIGGGKESAPKREPVPVKEVVSAEIEEVVAFEPSETSPEQREGKKRDRHRRRRRRGPEERPVSSEEAEATKESSVEHTLPIAPPPFTTLFPPPTTLISQTLSRYKEKEVEDKQQPQLVEEKPSQPQPIEENSHEKVEPPSPHKAEPEEGEGQYMHRMFSDVAPFTYSEDNNFLI